MNTKYMFHAQWISFNSIIDVIQIGFCFFTIACYPYNKNNIHRKYNQKGSCCVCHSLTCTTAPSQRYLCGITKPYNLQLIEQRSALPKQMSPEEENRFLEAYRRNDEVKMLDHFNRFKDKYPMPVSHNDRCQPLSKEEQYLRMAITSLLIFSAKKISGQDLSLIKELVNHHLTDVNARNIYGNAPIHIAILHGHLFFLKVLLSKENIDVNLLDKDGLAPIHRTIMQNAQGMLRMLLANSKTDPNILGKYHLAPIHRAIRLNRIELLDMLVQKEGIDLNILDRDGLSPIDTIIKFDRVHVHLNRKQLLSILLKKKNINLNILDKNGLAPIHNAIKFNRVELLPILLNNNTIDLNILDRSGLPLIRYLVHWYHPEIWEIFMNHTTKKIDINAKDKHGCTALHYALYQAGNPQEVSMEAAYALLEEKDIDVNAVANSLYTPIYPLILNKKFNESLFLKLLNHPKLIFDYHRKESIQPYAFAWLFGNASVMEVLKKDTRFITERLPWSIKRFVWKEQFRQLFKKSQTADLEYFGKIFSKINKKVIKYHKEKQKNLR